MGRFTSTLEEREGQDSGEDAGQTALSLSHPELSTEVHSFTPQNSGQQAQQLLRAPSWMGQNCLVKEEPQQGTRGCSAPIHGPGERCPAGSAELSRAGAPRRNQMFSTPLQAPLPKASREVSAPCSPWVRWQETARPQHCPAAEPRAETILLTHQPPTSSSSQ